MSKDATGRLLAARYYLERRLGAGGFGAVYEARDEQLQRRVAVKLLNALDEARRADDVEQVRERFRREAVATAAIVHPNVVTVYDVGVEGTEIYLVMELLNGRPLSEEMRSHPRGMDPQRIITLFMDALRGVGAGHQAGIVHKDLKPENLFLREAGTRSERLLVIDFGVARVLHEQKLTMTGRLVGTPRYLAPEYIDGHNVSPALDVYQAGLILVEALSGAPCIPRGTNLVDTCQRHMDGNLVIPYWLRRGEIGEVIRRATARDRRERYGSAFRVRRCARGHRTG